MFEHLDDLSPRDSGTQSQLSAVHRRGRALLRQRRRTRLATGSVALAATAGVAAVGVAGLPGGRASGSSGTVGYAGGADGVATAAVDTTPAVASPASGTTTAPTTAPTDAPTPFPSPSTSDGPHTPATATTTPLVRPTPRFTTPPRSPACAAVHSHIAGTAATPPAGYAHQADPNDSVIEWVRAGARPAILAVDVFCGQLPDVVVIPGGDGNRQLHKISLSGRDAWLWTEYDGSVAGVLWGVGQDAWVQVETEAEGINGEAVGSAGMAGARLSDADLTAFAAQLPAS